MIPKRSIRALKEKIPKYLQLVSCRKDFVKDAFLLDQSFPDDAYRISASERLGFKGKTKIRPYLVFEGFERGVLFVPLGHRRIVDDQHSRKYVQALTDPGGGDKTNKEGKLNCTDLSKAFLVTADKIDLVQEKVTSHSVSSYNWTKIDNRIKRLVKENGLPALQNRPETGLVERVVLFREAIAGAWVDATNLNDEQKTKLANAIKFQKEIRKEFENEYYRFINDKNAPEKRTINERAAATAARDASKKLCALKGKPDIKEEEVEELWQLNRQWAKEVNILSELNHRS